MKLSDAMVLGDTLAKRVCEEWVTKDMTGGCAVGRALMAINAKLPTHGSQLDPIYAAWPWLTYDHLRRISTSFNSVCRYGYPFEKLVESVRKIEPDCGECNQRVCTCPKTAEVVFAEDVVELTTLGGA